MSWTNRQLALAAPLTIIVGVVGLWLLVPTETSFGLFETNSGGNRILTAVVGFLITLVGVVLGATYRVLSSMKEGEGRRSIGRFSVFFRRVFHSIDLWMSLAAAPIVYGLILQSILAMSLAGLTIVALQNGFFCLALVSSLRPTVAD